MSKAPRRLYVFNAGFLTQKRVRRILELKGWDVRVGRPGQGDAIGVWGQSPTSRRGARVADITGHPIVRVEDAFLRSLFPGRAGEPTLGLLIDETGVHFDDSQPSDIETMLASHPLEDPALLARAEALVEAIRRAHLSKFAAVDPALPVPEPGYVLVIDQTQGDAAVRASGGKDAFDAMLETARAEHPDLPIVIKAHPETAQGLRAGHFEQVLTDPVSPWRLFEGAVAIHTLSSGLGFEAIIAGHRPVVYGAPFYAGWGLTEDRQTFPRRGRKLTLTQLSAAALLLYPTWYDPYRDALAEAEDVVQMLEAKARAWRDDRHGWVAHGVSRWKHPHMRAFFGGHGGIRFSGSGKGRAMAWASKSDRADTVRVEDGFLRSRGLGARLTPPLSLVLDDRGIYYDPGTPSRLEELINKSSNLSPGEIERSRKLVAAILATGLSKYNISGDLPELSTDQRRILVVGQVENDASVLKGAGDIVTNADLLALARAEKPDAALIYKPHPDVEAGLRKGSITLPKGVTLAANSDPIALIDASEEIWTMTSLLGFEALLRGKAVTTTGAPFYAGWGLTKDLGLVPARRTARPTIERLAHAALIGYPRYFDPVTGQACPPEIAVLRLASGETQSARGVLALLQRAKAWF